MKYMTAFSLCLPKLKDSSVKIDLLSKFIEHIKGAHSKIPFLQDLDGTVYARLFSGFDKDEKSQKLARRFINEGPFNHDNIFEKILIGFGKASNSLPKEIMEIFTDKILEDLKSNEQNIQNQRMTLLQEIGDNMLKVENRKLILDRVISLFASTTSLVANPIIFKTLSSCNKSIDPNQRDSIRTILSKNIEDTVPEIQFLIQNYVSLKEITSKNSYSIISNKFAKRNIDEKRQIFEEIKKHTIKQFDDAFLEQILLSILNDTTNKEQQIADKAINLIQECDKIFPTDIELILNIFNRIFSLIEDNKNPKREHLLSSLWVIKNVWIDRNEILTQITKRLNSWIEDELLKDNAILLLQKIKENRNTKL
jgi:hypothetical protein